MVKRRKLFLTVYSLTPHVSVPNAGILCEGDKIIGIGGVSAFSRDEPGLEVIDVNGCYALPGLIDSHVHGGGAFDTELAATPGAKMEEMSRYLASKGVTSFVPTLVSMERQKMLPTVAMLAEMMQRPMPGATPCGLHLEGPFINPEKAGTQSVGACSPIDLGFARELIQAGSGKIKIITFAPELPHADQLIELMLDNGIIPSMGHSLASAADALRAINAGAARCTHLYNGLPLIHHRHASITDVVLIHDEVAVEVILDGAHISPGVVNITARVKPNDKLIGVSNFIPFSTPRRRGYFERENKFYTPDGVLAGTGMTLDEGWMNLRSYAHMPDNLAAACFTSNPAQNLGLITRGELSPGKRADITFFDVATNRVAMTVSHGATVYKAAADS